MKGCAWLFGSPRRCLLNPAENSRALAGISVKLALRQTSCPHALVARASPVRSKCRPAPLESQRCCGSTGRAPRPPADEEENVGAGCSENRLRLRVLPGPARSRLPAGAHPLQPCLHRGHVLQSRHPAACRNSLVPEESQKTNSPEAGHKPEAAVTWAKKIHPVVEAVSESLGWFAQAIILRSGYRI